MARSTAIGTSPGTLAYGLNDANFTVGGVVQPRTIVFDVGGTIWLGRRGEDVGWDTRDPLSVGSRLTIAGQTAPGRIIILGGGLRVNGDNTIIRNMVMPPGTARGGSIPRPATPTSTPTMA